MFNEFRNRLAWLFRSSRFDRELAEEIDLHIEERAIELVGEGVSPEEARYQARREFGPALRSTEATRSAWQLQYLESLVSDLRYALRGIRRSPILAFAAVGSLALGIGANTTIFSVASEMLFSDPSCRDPKSLVQISFGRNSWIPMPQYRLIENSHALDGVGGMNIGMVVNWRNGDHTVRLAGTHVTDTFFEVAGIPVALGRPIAKGETNAAVITSGFWTRRLGGDPNVIGHTLALDGKPYTIVGVLPRDHRMLAGFGFSPDLYLTKDPGEVAMYARLPQGLTRRAAYDRLRQACQELDRVYPNPNWKWSNTVRISGVSGVERLQGQDGLAVPTVAFFFMLTAVTGVLVLIACANVSSLLLARAFSRSREFAIRMSLGAGRGRLIRQLLAESLLLAVLGTIVGFALDIWLTRLVNGVRIPTPLPIELSIQPDRALLLYCAAIAFAVTLATGLIPAFKGTRMRIGQALKDGGSQSAPVPSRLRSVMVVGQLALSITLLSIGMLFTRSLLQATSFNAGFDTKHTLVTSVGTVRGSYTPDKFAALVDNAIKRLKALPGVDAVSPTFAVPLNPFLAFSRETGAARSDEGTEVQLSFNSNFVGSDYFRALEIPILQGRPFDDGDRKGSPGVVILNENFARRLFPKDSAVGHTVRLPDKREVRVVGIARNSRYVTLGEQNAMAMYAPWSQQQFAIFVHFIVRTNGSPEVLVRNVDDSLSSLDSSATVETHTMDQIFAGALMPSRVAAAILGSMAAFGLLLASIGLYGVLLYAIQQRVREIGIRVALGAAPLNILGMVYIQSSRLVASGLVIGVAIAAIAGRPLAMFLVPGVRPADPLNFVWIAVILAFVSGLATIAPTIRALRIDPAAALRHD